MRNNFINVFFVSLFYVLPYFFCYSVNFSSDSKFNQLLRSFYGSFSVDLSEGYRLYVIEDVDIFINVNSEILDSLSYDNLINVLVGENKVAQNRKNDRIYFIIKIVLSYKSFNFWKDATLLPKIYFLAAPSEAG